MKWHFTEIDDDSRILKDPTQHTVQAHTSELTDLQIFVREVLQNSLDNALSKSSVNVDFRLKYCERAENDSFLSNLKFDQISEHVDPVIKYQLNEYKVNYFATSPKMISDHKYVMKILYIEDFGTRGLVGPEYIREKERFNRPHCFLGLCRNVGDSQKGKEMLG